MVNLLNMSIIFRLFRVLEIPGKAKALSSNIRIFLNPQLCLSGYGFRPHLRLNPLPRLERVNPQLIRGRVNDESGYFKIR